MILLDSDHLTMLKYRDSDRFARLTARLQAAVDETVGTTIVNVEEQMRGWLASVAKERSALRQVTAYRELAGLFEYFSKLHIAAFNDAAANRFQELRAAQIKIGSMDLKVASIAIVHDAVLLTANRKDFEKVPGLRFESWLD